MPDAENESVTAETVRVRRTPRYGRFMLIGAVVFAIAAFIVTYSLPQGPGYDRNTVFGLVLVVAVAVGVALGGLVAIALNALGNKRARTLTADRVVVAPSSVAEDALGEHAAPRRALGEAGSGGAPAQRDRSDDDGADDPAADEEHA